MKLENILIKPLMSEKSSVLNEKRNVYCFEVSTKANKNQVSQAVEAFYNVKVLSCNTSILPGKVVNLGLDLKGGSYLLLQANVNVAIRERIDTTLSDIRRTLRKNKIKYKMESPQPAQV